MCKNSFILTDNQLMVSSISWKAHVLFTARFVNRLSLSVMICYRRPMLELHKEHDDGRVDS